jgi:hypothetical protein
MLNATCDGDHAMELREDVGYRMMTSPEWLLIDSVLSHFVVKNNEVKVAM